MSESIRGMAAGIRVMTRTRSVITVMPAANLKLGQFKARLFIQVLCKRPSPSAHRASSVWPPGLGCRPGSFK
jgi:hypothetical protein